MRLHSLARRKGAFMRSSLPSVGSRSACASPSSTPRERPTEEIEGGGSVLEGLTSAAEGAADAHYRVDAALEEMIGIHRSLPPCKGVQPHSECTIPFKRAVE